jgi:hypothetical protein
VLSSKIIFVYASARYNFVEFLGFSPKSFEFLKNSNQIHIPKKFWICNSKYVSILKFDQKEKLFLLINSTTPEFFMIFGGQEGFHFEFWNWALNQFWKILENWKRGWAHMSVALPITCTCPCCYRPVISLCVTPSPSSPLWPSMPTSSPCDLKGHRHHTYRMYIGIVCGQSTIARRGIAWKICTRVR